MKLTTLAAVVASSMLAATFAYAAPAADMGMNDDSSSTMPPAASSAPSSMDNTNIGAIPPGTPGDMASNTSSSMEGGMAMNPGATDDMSADTATGDDDY